MLGMVVALATTASACSDDPIGSALDDAGSTGTTTVPSTAAPSSRADPAPGPDDPPNPSRSAGEAPIERTWLDAFDASARLAAGELDAADRIDAITSGRANASFRRLLDSDETMLHHVRVAVDDDAGTAEIQDCVVFPDHRPAEGSGAISGGLAAVTGGVVLIHGGAVRSSNPSGQWTISDFEIAPGGCIPADAVDGILAGHASFLAARQGFFDPPDPANPTIDETTTGEARQLVLDAIAVNLANGTAVRHFPEANQPVITEFRIGRAAIEDCVASIATGLFDAATGTRRGDAEPDFLYDDQPDRHRAELILEGGRWKVSASSIQEGSCSGGSNPPAVEVFSSP